MAYILIVEDEDRMRQLLAIMLQRKGHKTDQASDGTKALQMMADNTYDMVISDIKMPKTDGLTLLQTMREQDIQCPVVFITAFATIDSAVEAMRCGAADYITKPFEEERILLTIERTLNLSRIIAENRDLKAELKKVSGSDEIVYASEKMAVVMSLAFLGAKSDSAVMITGESGTGKELLAKFIHRSSNYSKGRFVAVNCAAISPNLVESELFGHERGSFTGADRRAQGKFEYASGGTLFLDEIGDLPLEAQAKLLRALQEKKIRRVGGNEEIPVDVRVICATNRNLNEQVEKSAFRQDLFFRINVFPIQPPPLRERIDDIEPLVAHFLKKNRNNADIQLTEGAVSTLKKYHWPGNIRELANVIERAIILAGDQNVITAETLSFLKPAQPSSGASNGFKLPPEGIMLEEVEKDWVRQALELSGDNQTLAAKLLGLTRAKFRVLLKQVR